MALAPLLLLGGWRFARGQGWAYSRFGWSIAAKDCRESMARDYLATKNVVGLTLDQLRADLGAESTYRESWTYAVGAYIPKTMNGLTYYYERPNLHLQFSRRGVLESLSSSRLWDGPIASFDVETWQATPSADRGAMARDVIESQALLGTSRQEVRELLGDPDSVDIWVDYRVGDRGSDGSYLEARLNLDGLIIDACVTPR